jgi:hypothetical protein
MQERQPLGDHLRGETVDAGRVAARSKLLIPARCCPGTTAQAAAWCYGSAAAMPFQGTAVIKLHTERAAPHNASRTRTFRKTGRR